MPARPVPKPLASTALPEPMNAWTSLVTGATPTAAPTPTKPPAMAIWSSTSFVSSVAATSTSPPATMITLSPVLAYVWTLRTATDTLPATPTVPPPAPTTTDTIVSVAVADTTTSSAALTWADAPMNA